ncbi:hypothetical protein ACUN24_20365 [Pedobacter sp. WC2501]|uniref:hypothetical protein n=1 Tax=Pedobacter sp. WC2501 TaxID=3461400 RepID=UPI004045EB87
MKIDRKELLEQLIAFAQIASGVIIGNPGVGKTYTLSELMSALLAQKIPAAMVRMDFLLEATDPEIAQSLGMPTSDWLILLKNIQLPDGKKGVLIFDSFDSVRDERLKDILIRQISRAKNELPEWSILVSVRSYDAAKSQKLIDLFPAKFSDDGIHCRKFLIPVLSRSELDPFFQVNPSISAVFHGGEQKLKEVLRIPFFLNLLQLILANDAQNIEDIRLLRSEIQLLEMYWEKVIYKIDLSDQVELLLMDLTKSMVDAKTLSVNKLDYLAVIGMGNVAVFAKLLSANILSEQETVSSKLGFSHNILFDYAVSRLLLRDTAAQIIEFILEDNARPFFLRPSFIYFFSSLWYLQNERFWEIYQELSISELPQIILFNKLIPATVIAREFDDVDQLKIFEGPANLQTIQVRNILQAIRFIGEKSNKFSHLGLLLVLSSRLELAFIWDFVIVLELLVRDPDIIDSKNMFSMCGTSSRNLMSYLLDERIKSPNQNLDQLASYRGTEMVARTFATDVPASKEILRRVMSIMEEKDFPISYISYLSESLVYFYKHDPQFAAEIYAGVFARREIENTPTITHSSVLMTFKTNRRDDFELCHFRLLRFFPEFLSAYPSLCIPLGLNIVNAFIRKRNNGEIEVANRIAIPQAMLINGVPALYKVDMSAMWAENIDLHKPFSHTALIIDFLESTLTTPDEWDISDMLNIYIAHADFAFNWKAILDLGSKRPEQLYVLLYELLLQPPILYWSDTVFEAARFLEQIAKLLSDPQILAIENVILSLSGFIKEKDIDNVDTRVIRLLGRIPKDKLGDERSLAFLGDKTPVPNEPVVKYTSSFGPVTTEMFLSDVGVDISEPKNEELLSMNAILEQFNRTYQNQFPDIEIFLDPSEIALKLFLSIKENDHIPKRLSQTILQEIAAFYSIILNSVYRVNSIRLPIEYSTIKEIMLYCLNLHTESDDYAEENYSPASGYTSTPRSEAAQGIPYLFGISQDKELLAVMDTFSKDKNAVTRFHILKSLYVLYQSYPETFWSIVFDRMQNESDSFTKASVIRNLDNKVIFENDSDRLLKAFEMGKESIIKLRGNNSFLENYLTIALGFYRRSQNESIKNILEDCLSQNPTLLKNLIYHAFQIIEPANFYRNYADPKDVELNKRIVEILLSVLDRAEIYLKTFRVNEENESEELKESFIVLDTMIQRIYFSMQVNERLNKMHKDRLAITDEDREKFYFFVKPLLERILEISSGLVGGLIQAHTAHYFIEIMAEALKFDAAFSLSSITRITQMTAGTAYSFDRSAIQEVVRFTEKLLVDHKNMLADPEAFTQIMALLTIYVDSGWPDALELLWKLDEVFR